MMKTKRPLLYKEGELVDLSTKTRREIIQAPPCSLITIMVGEALHWTVLEKSYMAKVLGDKIFYKTNITKMLTFKDGRFFGSMDWGLLKVAIEVHRLNWITDNWWLKDVLGTRKDLWARIFSGKITNPEALVKAFSKKNFKGAFSYKALKDYFMIGKGYQIHLWDLYYHTTNPEVALRKNVEWATSSNPEGLEYLMLLRDTLRYCQYDNTKVNPLWSINRIRRMHNEQTLQADMEEYNRIPDITVCKPFEADGLELLLNSKKTWMEGYNMKNCVYRCYWSQIQAGNYLIARGKVGTHKVDVGMRVTLYPDDIRFTVDQVEAPYHGEVSSDVWTFCVDWVDRHKKELIKVVEAIKGKDYYPKEEELPW